MAKSKKARTIRTVVLDMQPITPTLGGGRQRLLGIWHALTPDLSCQYIGTYDWPGEAVANRQLTPTLHERLVPLSDQHFSLNDIYTEAAGGQTTIDSLFHIFGRLSPEYIAAASQAISDADIVAFEHPWIYPLVSHLIGDRTVIYSSQNVEALLKKMGLRRSLLGMEVAKAVAMCEGALVDRADHVFACSTEDKNLFAMVYGVPLERISLAPNGVFASQIVPLGTPPISNGIKRVRAIFIGSGYGPNREAALHIVEQLAPANPEIDFILLGGVSGEPSIQSSASAHPNVELAGMVSDEEKLSWLQGADLAINPMFSGSGTNVKMFDFMSVGLPVLATPTGARGIARVDRGGVMVRAIEDFNAALREMRVLSRADLRELGAANRQIVLDEFAWEDISVGVGERILEVHQSRPVSNLVPAIAPAIAPAVAAPPARISTAITFVSTFGIKCGIAGYTECLTEALSEAGADVLVLAANTPLETPSSSTAKQTVKALWFFDNVEWRAPALDIGALVAAGVAHGRNSAFNVQYHPAFYSFAELVGLCEAAIAAGLVVSVTLHNSAVMNDDMHRELLLLGIIVFVHDRNEAGRLAPMGNVRFLPFGIQDVRSMDVTPSPVGSQRQIGTFGFLRPHKGIANLIEAMAIVRQVHPDLTLKAFCSLYPSEDSQREHERCRALIADLDLHGSVTLDTAHHPIEATLSALSHSVLNILPYQDSNEGASGAASACLGARRPLLTSHSRIFDPLGQTVYRCSDAGPKGLALSILNMLANTAVLDQFEAIVNAHVDENNWSQVAALFDAHIQGTLD